MLSGRTELVTHKGGNFWHAGEVDPPYIEATILSVILLVRLASSKGKVYSEANQSQPTATGYSQWRNFARIVADKASPKSNHPKSQ